MKIKFIGIDLDIALIYILHRMTYIAYINSICIFDVEEHVIVLVFYDSKKCTSKLLFFYISYITVLYENVH